MDHPNQRIVKFPPVVDQNYSIGYNDVHCPDKMWLIDDDGFVFLIFYPSMYFDPSIPKKREKLYQRYPIWVIHDGTGKRVFAIRFKRSILHHFDESDPPNWYFTGHLWYIKFYQSNDYDFATCDQSDHLLFDQWCNVDITKNEKISSLEIWYTPFHFY